MRVGGRLRRVHVVVWALGVVVIALGAFSTWSWWSARADAAAQLVTVTATGAVECADGREVNDGRRLLVVATPGVRCDVEVEITNYSEHVVHLLDINSVVGTTQAAGNQLIVAVAAGTQDFEAEGDEILLFDTLAPVDPVMEDPEMGAAGSPATYELDADLASYDALRTRIAVTLNEENCRGGTTTLAPWPLVNLRAEGLRRSVSASTRLEIELARTLPPDGPGCDDSGS